MTDPSIIGPATMAVGQGVAAFNAFLPRLSEVRKADPTTDHSLVADVRTGEIAAVALTVGIGAIASSLTGSHEPAVVSVVVAIGLVIIYETALRRQQPMDATNTTQGDTSDK